MERFLIVGNGGREAAFASSLAKDSTVCAIVGHANPLIVKCVERTGGSWTIGKVAEPIEVAAFAKRCGVDYAFVSADYPMSTGVVDGLMAAGIKTVGATKYAARIEWDKLWAANLTRRVCPEIMPFHIPVRDESALDAAIDEFESSGRQVVVKPQGLTGGRGVKVMGPHLKTYNDCRDYAMSVMRENPGEGVLLVERIDGIEFTIMCLTDGDHTIMAPATYDYPYKRDGDPGTGGVGCFAGPNKALPFMTGSELRQCHAVMRAVLREIANLGMKFTGVFNGGFFVTAHGIKFMEFNSRFGDPESMSILHLLRTPFSDVVKRMYHGTLTRDSVRFARAASVVKYLTGPEYPSTGRTRQFSINTELAEKLGATVWTSACLEADDMLVSMGSSRSAAVGALASTIQEASRVVNHIVDRSETGGLEVRRDIGSESGLRALAERAALIRGSNDS